MARIITLDEDSHKYTVDGEPVPSVSEITRFISREIYGEISQYTLENAAARGTKVHKATESLDHYGSVEADEETAPYLEAYIKFRREHKVKWIHIEWMLDYKDQFCGTLDRTGEIDGVETLVDIKTSSSLQKVLYTAQLSLYMMLARENGYEPKKMLILHLMKDGNYKLVELQEDQTLAESLLYLHNALKKKPRKRKEKEQ